MEHPLRHWSPRYSLLHHVRFNPRAQPLDIANRGTIEHQVACKMQGHHFTGGPDLGILDRFKILDMCEAENAAHHLCGCKADAVREDPRHGSPPMCLERFRAGRIGKKLCYKCVTGRGFAPEREELRLEPDPDRL